MKINLIPGNRTKRHFPRPGFALWLLLLGLAATGQAPTPPQKQKPQPAQPVGPPVIKKLDLKQELATLAKRVKEALYGKEGKPIIVSSYHADLSIELLADRKQEIEAHQDFKSPKSIRTEIDDPGAPRIMRGYDGRNYWQAVRGKRLVELSGRDYKTDKQQVRDECRFAGQITRLFQVDRILQELGEPKLKHDVSLKVISEPDAQGHRKLINRKCTLVGGKIADFPFYLKTNREFQDKDAAILLWFDGETAQVRQIRVWPILAEKSDSMPLHSRLRSETIQLASYHPVKGNLIRIPTYFRIRSFHRTKGKDVSLMAVTLDNLLINKKFAKDHFSPQAGLRYANAGKKQE